jgi:eukaryotic-like serine/threonine-protein kinase
MEKRAQAGHGTEFTSNVRFGLFELDLRRGELRKEGSRIRLQDQPFQILRILLESPGEVVSREEIRNRLWPDETVVEFDHSINVAVRRLRDALGDSADNPHYIKTVARRGYRFIGVAEIRLTQAEGVPLSENGAPRRENGAQRVENDGAPWRPRPRVFIPVALAAIILMVWAGARYYWRGAKPLQPVMQLDVDLGTDTPPATERGADAILSPDGTRLVYVSQSKLDTRQQRKLFTRRLDQAEATELPGTEGAVAPFFSPDGQWVGFFTGGRLMKVSIQKSQVMLVGDGFENGASWGEDGSIIVGYYRRLARISAAGGTPIPVTELAPGEYVHRYPQVLPGGKAVIFSAYRSWSGLDGAAIEVVSLRDGHRKTLVPGGTYGRYLPSGHLVYIYQGTLFAVRFDLDRLEVHGTPTQVLENVAYSTAWGSAQIDFSRTGALVYQSSKAGSGLVTVQWLDESGNTRPLLAVPENYLSPTLSPDGNRLALTISGDIWVYELGRGRMTQLTVGGGYTYPLWSADGRYLVFRGAKGIFWLPADRTAQPQALTQGLPWSTQGLPGSFTRDGKRLAFMLLSPANFDDIWTVPVETGSSGLRVGEPELLLQGPFQERAPTFSPDGRWMAYMSNESGRFQVYVRAFPDGRGNKQISTDRGLYPAWSHNGRDLFFLSKGVLMAASYQARGDSFVAEKPRVWFGKPIPTFGPTMSYDPAPDGKRVVALMPADSPQESQTHVIFLLNFFDELRRRVPAGSN